MRIDDFLVSEGRRDYAAAPEADALIEDGALQEAALLDVKLCAVTGVAWILFDCRGALQLESGNTAILVLRSLSELQWEGQPTGVRTWPAVTRWSVRSPGAHLLEVVAGIEPAATLRAVCAAGEFFVGDVPGCDDPPPNFLTASEGELRAGLQGWASEFEPVHASFLN
ncbi:hypothetical protein [Cellulomonas iranensis]|jgi:hypothetical protein|uniref:hypothetical protein n=1 Tax=Cellulomonas iranensis TaxID=76862 RepID=UPI0013D51C44|nr:hypothetical protein [Cellulomonas iranensis]